VTPAQDWIEAAAEEQLGEARGLGLAPKPH
jgi:hypothetical protein